MSNTPQGPGWWQASDGLFYPPEQSPALGRWQASDGKWYPPQAAQPGATHQHHRQTTPIATERRMRFSAFFFGLAVLAFILFAVFGDDDGAGVPTRA